MRRRYIFIIFSIIVILLQVNNYTTLNTLITDDSEPSTQGHHQRDYEIIIYYLSTIFTILCLLFIKSCYQQYNHHTICHNSTLEQWLHWEWRLFSYTLSLNTLLKAGSLIILNILLICLDDNAHILQLTALNDDPTVTFKDIRKKEIANRYAYLSVANMAISVLFSAKLSFIQQLFFDIVDTLQWHKWVSCISIIQMLYHAAYQINHNLMKKHSLYLALTSNMRYTTGTWMMVAMFCLLFGSHPLIRLLSYRLFRISHILSFVILILMGLLHHWTFYIFYVMVIGFWIVDQLDRSYQTDIYDIQTLPGDIIRLQIPLPYSMPDIIPGQFAFISFSSSWFSALVNSHPFSICKVEQVKQEDEDNSSEMPICTFYIKAVGKQTKQIYSYSQTEQCKIRISKPLGRKYLTGGSAEYGDFQHIVLVADGTGITPWISVLYYIKEKQHQIKTERIELIWCIHSIDTYLAFEEELGWLCRSIEITLRIDMYVTGSMDYESAQSLELPPQIHISHSKPDYSQTIQSSTMDTVLAICAHEDTIVQCNNIGLRYSWVITKERFQL